MKRPRDRNGRPEIIVRPELAEVVDEAERALLADLKREIYTRGGLLVRIIRDGACKVPGLTRTVGAPLIVPVREPWLREQLDRAARWVARKPSQSGEPCTVRALPPAWVASTLAGRGEWPFPPVEGVVEAPVLRPDGSILDVPGYDLATGLRYEPGTACYPSVPREPTPADVEIALHELLTPFDDFPFLDPSDRAVIVANILTLVGRPAISGPTPFFFYRSPTPGNGKGLCARCVAVIAMGRDAPLMTAPKDDEETRKRILSIGLAGERAVLIDNVVGSFGSKSLSAALTAEHFSDRLLGQNRTISVPLRVVWMGTGNNVTFRGDLGRRVVPCDMDAEEEHPEDRTGFKIPRLQEYVAKHHSRLISAALTILRGYHVAGRPGHGKPEKGSFEAWDALVRGAVIWAGLADPLETCERIRQDGDSDRAALHDALAMWEGTFGDRRKTAAEAVEEAKGDPELAGALAALVGRSVRELDAARLGYALRSCRRRRVRGRWFDNEPGRAGTSRWFTAASPRRDGGDDEIE